MGQYEAAKPFSLVDPCPTCKRPARWSYTPPAVLQPSILRIACLNDECPTNDRPKLELLK